MTIKPHEVTRQVIASVSGLSDASFRELGKDAGCFSATRAGRRTSISVYLDMLPARTWFGVYMPALWTEDAIAKYVVTQMGGGK